MTSAESTTETEQLSGRVLGIIGSYGMAAALDARDLYLKTAPEAVPPSGIPVDGNARNGRNHAGRTAGA